MVFYRWKLVWCGGLSSRFPVWSLFVSSIFYIPRLGRLSRFSNKPFSLQVSWLLQSPQHRHLIGYRSIWIAHYGYCYFAVTIYAPRTSYHNTYKMPSQHYFISVHMLHLLFSLSRITSTSSSVTMVMELFDLSVCSHSTSDSHFTFFYNLFKFFIRLHTYRWFQYVIHHIVSNKYTFCFLSVSVFTDLTHIYTPPEPHHLISITTHILQDLMVRPSKQARSFWSFQSPYKTLRMLIAPYSPP